MEGSATRETHTLPCVDYTYVGTVFAGTTLHILSQWMCGAMEHSQAAMSIKGKDDNKMKGIYGRISQ